MNIVSIFKIAGLLLITLTFQNCEQPEEIKTPLETGTVTDIDNNVYKTVKIGNQWWMAENLKVTRFRNGTLIPEIESQEEWKNATSGGFCNYNNSPNDAGLLYNFFTVVDTNNIAPEGWHVPSDDEWKQLEIHLGMNATDVELINWRGNSEGDGLKIEGPEGWTRFENVWGTNESGFTALAGSCRLFDGAWGEPGLFATGFWWSSSFNDNKAWYRHLDYKNSNIFRYRSSVNYGFSIRCVKD